MDQQKTSATTNKSACPTQEQSMKVWHRPILKYIPLQVTANAAGSSTDGTTSAPTPQ